jgi:hypothetical protein
MTGTGMAGRISPDDIRAAVAAGIVTEAQAASVLALADARAGRRAGLPSEDEPFEFFRGFSEIFVSIGLIILMAGIASLLALFGGVGMLLILPLICAGIAWWWAGYFTLRRRMNLPSMVLALAFGGGVYLSAVTAFAQVDLPLRGTAMAGFAVAAGAMGLWYRRFRLPFAAFILGLFTLGAVYSATASLTSLAGLVLGDADGLAELVDLRQSPAFAFATLAFGAAFFVAGMWFDTRDPHRLGRHAATAFWLHLLAAPALVNPVALTLYNLGGSGGIAALAICLAVIAVLALVIDRRSFLTAAIVYIALVLGWAFEDGAGGLGGVTTTLIILGAIVTALGTWWVQLRAALMRALPDFPGKSSLPPVSRPE